MPQQLTPLGRRIAATLLTLTAAATAIAIAPAPAQASPPVSPPPVVTLEYDAQGNPKRTIQAPGVAGYNLITSHGYDRLHRHRDTTDARSGVTRLDYNGREDLIQVTDPRNLVTQYPRNGLGEATSLISPDTGTAAHTFDAAGNLRTRQDSRGALASHSYDVLNRLTSTTHTQAGQASQVFSWTYDQTGAGFSFGVGRLTSTSYEGGSTRLAYDAQGRLSSTTQYSETEALLALNTSYGYGPAGHIVSITYPSGQVLYIPHAGGLPTSLSLAANPAAAAVPLISQLQHEPFGQIRAWAWHLSIGTQQHGRVFDTSGRMVRYPIGGALRDITYDAADRISSYTHLDRASGTATAAAAALNQAFGYDELGRLTNVTSSIGNWAYGHDANGNRTSIFTSAAGGSGGTTRNHIVAANSNRLLGLDNPPRSMSHDAAGNTVADQQGTSSQTGWTASYDASGRVNRIRASSNGSLFSTTAYGYNGAGQRVLKQPLSFEICSTPTNCNSRPIYVGGVVYAYDQDGQMLGEYNAQTGAPIREYIWLQGMPLAVVAYDMGTASDPVPVFYIHADHINTPRVALDRSGAQRWSWVAEPFGNSSPSANPLGLGNFELNLRMPGQYFDVESGLSYNWHRDYDGSVGRYTQSDPIGLSGGINTYAYADGSPTTRTDPLGLATFMCTKPLHALGGDGLRSGPDIPGNPLYHQYVCVPGANGQMQCGGQDRANGAFGPGKPSDDQFKPGSCEKVEDDNKCVEQCILSAVDNPRRPPYWLVGGGTSRLSGEVPGIGMNCQQWADYQVRRCVAQCRKK